MTSLFMGHLIQGGWVPADEATVRNTATPVDVNAPPAMATDMPVMGEVETDHNPNLGMVNRQVASKWFDRIRYRPFWQGNVDAQDEHNAIVDRQVSTSGYSASQEAAGQWGHGTMSYAVGIEPVADLNGGKMGNEYFKTVDKDIQSTSDNTMMSVPPGYAHDNNVPAAGKVAARKAAQAALYNSFWNGGH